MDDLKHHILLCPGPFVTARIVQRTAPRVQQGFVHQNCAQAFTVLQSMGLWKTLFLNKHQLVYYKPLPTPAILHLLQASMKIQVDKEEYKAIFCTCNHSLFTHHQFDKLLSHAPHKDELIRQFGFSLIHQ